MKIVVVSDAHLGLSEPSDTAFIEMVQTVVQEENCKLILLGDMFEFWIEDPVDVLVEYAELLDLLKGLIRDNQVVYIWGNHDWQFSAISDLERWPGVEEYEYTEIQQFRFIHGFQFEGRETHLAANAMFYRTDPQTMHVLYRFWKWLTKRSAWNMYNPPGERLSSTRHQWIRRNAEEYQEEHQSPDGVNPWVIYGHTHEFFIDEEAQIANTGCWLAEPDNEDHEYLVITITKDGQVNVEREVWPR